MKDIASSIFWLILGVFYLIYSLEYPAGSIANMQPGFFPRLIGMVVIGLSGGAFLSSLKQRGRTRPTDLWEGFQRKNLVSAAMAIAGIVLYLVILNVIGFLAASFLLVFSLARIMGGRSWTLNALTGAVTSGVMYWAFWIVMRVPVPLGTLWEK
jgi:putative tricarboxylic transport membrane protein